MSIRSALDSLQHFSETQPTQVLLSDGESSLTYAEFAERTTGAAVSLKREGVDANDLVAIYTEEPLTFFISLFAIWRTGAIAVPLNTRIPEGALRDIVEQTKLRKIIGELPMEEPTLEPISLDDIPTEGVAVLEDVIQLERPAIIMFTSGSTGRPKGVSQSMYAISANAHYTAIATTIGPDDRILVNTPPCFTSSICHFLTLLAAGGSYVGISGFHFGDDTLALVREHGCSGFGGSPAHLKRVLDPLESPVGSLDVRFWVSSGDHLPPDMIEKFGEIFPATSLFYMYGLTEVSGRLCIKKIDPNSTIQGTVGKPIGEMKVTVRREDGSIAEPDEGGEIYVEGPLLCDGYFRLPDAARDSFSEFGFRTRDFGRLDGNGELWVEGRLDDILKIGGEKVSTVAVARALTSLDGVDDATVLVVDDVALGTALVGFVAVGTEAPINKASLFRSLRKLLPINAIPKRIELVDSVPRTGSGKVDRKSLAALLE